MQQCSCHTAVITAIIHRAWQSLAKEPSLWGILIQQVWPKQRPAGGGTHPHAQFARLAQGRGGYAQSCVCGVLIWAWQYVPPRTVSLNPPPAEHPRSILVYKSTRNFADGNPSWQQSGGTVRAGVKGMTVQHVGLSAAIRLAANHGAPAKQQPSRDAQQTLSWQCFSAGLNAQVAFETLMLFPCCKLHLLSRYTPDLWHAGD
jgi:hypothetical protein